MSSFITKRDVDLIGCVDSFGFLSTGQIKKLFFTYQHRSVASRRLSKLKKRGLLRSTSGLPLGELVWRLTPKALRAVGSENFIKSVNKNTLSHDVLVSDVRILLEKNHVGSHWKSAQEVIRVSRHPKYVNKDIIPDWFFKFKGNKKLLNCALEVELHLKSATRMSETFKNYANQNAYSIVWYFVPNKKMGQKLAEGISRHHTNRSGLWFFYSVIGDLESNLNDLKLYHKEGFLRLSQITKMVKLENG